MGVDSFKWSEIVAALTVGIEEIILVGRDAIFFLFMLVLWTGKRCSEFLFAFALFC